MLRELDWMTYIMMILASYRFTHLIVFDKITEFLRDPFMKKEKVKSEDGHTEIKKVPASKFGYLLNCYWCAGVWSAILIALGYFFIPTIAMPLIFIFSIAGAQAILETFVGVGTKAIDLLSAAKKRMD
ncbi:hypothetical protein B1690_14510 [Geobacillus sp. 46C-IIa]|uniref:DUF1360 domain-containing protein n=1 Tax=Geobacillus sp. 46C-IIa TaxID=1963025 RepID=UPI0009C1100D|nr:DUF1360 domain-containing protein [Geobacillus sp. 46C-IIa]OQP05195.1 hypothetical protein B1690_14510 [Geobacillus sp. 46C-IIa]QNU28118.1 DUF1360 domain-containing protein [Geobacillus sp. 46C-IIa]